MVSIEAARRVLKPTGSGSASTFPTPRKVRNKQNGHARKSTSDSATSVDLDAVSFAELRSAYQELCGVHKTLKEEATARDEENENLLSRLHALEQAQNSQAQRDEAKHDFQLRSQVEHLQNELWVFMRMGFWKTAHSERVPDHVLKMQ